MNINSKYKSCKVKVFKNIRNYIMFNGVFIMFNLVVIMVNKNYSFPKNFFAMWPLLCWGVPTLNSFINLQRMKKDD